MGTGRRCRSEVIGCRSAALICLLLDGHEVREVAHHRSDSLTPRPALRADASNVLARDEHNHVF